MANPMGIMVFQPGASQLGYPVDLYPGHDPDALCRLRHYADKDFDPHVERTKNRPLAARQVSTKEALLLAAGLSLAAFLLIIRLNKLTILLSFVALFLAASYPFTKRFFAMPQAYLGIAFGFGIPMAFAAQTGQVPALAWALLAANVFWSIAYDTEYAMVDKEDDVKIGIRTSAITLGRYDVIGIMFSYLAMLGILLGIGIWQHMGIYYFAGILAALGIASYHYTMIKGRDRDKCFKAFLHNNWLGAALFAGIVLDYWLRAPTY